VLLSWRENHAAELGAHLHVWNTPPFAPGESWRACCLPASAQLAKLERLLASHHELLGQPARSFRMGRFEPTKDIMAHLPRMGIEVDSSLLPLHWRGPRVQPFLAPGDPYPLHDPRPAGGSFWEAPLTVLPVWPGSARAVHRLSQALPSRPGRRLLDGFRYVGAAGVQPTMFSGPAMRLATRLHLARGGRALTMFLHSSELMPGGSPAYASEAAVDGLLGKIAGFLHWLTRRWPVRGVTLGQLPAALSTAGIAVP
jgi:hypothetical protein